MFLDIRKTLKTLIKVFCQKLKWIFWRPSQHQRKKLITYLESAWPKLPNVMLSEIFIFSHYVPLRGHNDFFDIITISTRMNLESNHSTLTPLPPLEGSEKIMISVIKCGQGWFEYIIANYFVPSILWCFYIPLVHTSS